MSGGQKRKRTETEKTASGHTMSNYYENIPKKYKQEPVEYPAYNEVHIKVPFRMVITGGTGSGKTNFLLNTISKINTWEKIYLFAKDLEEPLYATFIDAMREVEKKTGQSLLFTSNDISTIADPSTFNPKSNSLLIIDDMVTEKDANLRKVAEFWIRGRKRNVACVFIGQDYFKVPTIMRKNSEFFSFARINTNRDLRMILKDFRLGVTEEEIEDLYQRATQDGFPDVFMIDVTATDKYRFRRNFQPLEIPGDPLLPENPTYKITKEEGKKDEESDDKEKKGIESNLETMRRFQTGIKRKASEDSDSNSDSEEDKQSKSERKRPRVAIGSERLVDRVRRLCLTLKMSQALFKKCAKEMGLSVKQYCAIIEEAERRGEVA